MISAGITLRKAVKTSVEEGGTKFGFVVTLARVEVIPEPRDKRKGPDDEN